MEDTYLQFEVDDLIEEYNKDIAILDLKEEIRSTRKRLNTKLLFKDEEISSYKEEINNLYQENILLHKKLKRNYEDLSEIKNKIKILQVNICSDKLDDNKNLKITNYFIKNK